MGRYTHPKVQWIDGNGDPLAGGKLYFYITGTSTPKDTYTTEALSVANANPVVADANGVWSDIWLGTGSYKVILKDQNDVQIWSADPVTTDGSTIPTSAALTYDIVVKVGSDGGSALATGTVDDIRHKVTGTVQGWTVINDASGSVTWGVRRKAYVQDSPPAVGDSIVASAPPATASHRSETSTTLTGWTTSYTTGDWWEFVLTAVDGVVKRSTLILHCTRTAALS